MPSLQTRLDAKIHQMKASLSPEQLDLVLDFVGIIRETLSNGLYQEETLGVAESNAPRPSVPVRPPTRITELA